MQEANVTNESATSQTTSIGGLRPNIPPSASTKGESGPLVEDEEGSAQNAEATQPDAVSDADMGEDDDLKLDSAVNPIALLTSQHREVDALFEAIEESGEKAYRTKEKLVEKLAEKLQLHAKIEEKIFYPAVKALADDQVLEAFEEHESMKHKLKRLSAAAAKDEDFDAKVSVLKEIVQHHVKEEEEELFPKVGQALDPQELDEIFARMQRLIEREDNKEAKLKQSSRHGGKSSKNRRATRH